MSGIDAPPPAGARMRIDRWLWVARFYKTRTLAAREARAGHIRLNGGHIRKASTTVGIGDVLTFAKARRVRIVRITGLAERRGPAAAAAALYDDLSPPPPPKGVAEAMPPLARARGSGRPTKAERRALDRLRGGG